jgi:hypothetical protein
MWNAYFEGQLKSVAFVAASPAETIRWFVVNCGQLQQAFSQFLPDEAAEAIVEALSRGETVQFPGLYHREQFSSGFHNPWSPTSTRKPNSCEPPAAHAPFRKLVERRA